MQQNLERTDNGTMESTKRLHFYSTASKHGLSNGKLNYQIVTKTKLSNSNKNFFFPTESLIN